MGSVNPNTGQPSFKKKFNLRLGKDAMGGNDAEAKTQPANNN